MVYRCASSWGSRGSFPANIWRYIRCMPIGLLVQLRLTAAVLHVRVVRVRGGGVCSGAFPHWPPAGDACALGAGCRPPPALLHRRAGRVRCRRQHLHARGARRADRRRAPFGALQMRVVVGHGAHWGRPGERRPAAAASERRDARRPACVFISGRTTFTSPSRRALAANFYYFYNFSARDDIDTEITQNNLLHNFVPTKQIFNLIKNHFNIFNILYNWRKTQLREMLSLSLSLKTYLNGIMCGRVPKVL